MESEIVIRRAVAGDASGIAAVAESVRYGAGNADGKQGYLVYVGTVEEYRERLEETETSFVAEWAGEIVGFLIASEWGANTATQTEGEEIAARIFGQQTLLVDQIGVRGDVRGLGIAPRLFERLKSSVTALRISACIMHGPVRNERSIGFFAGRWEFRCVGEYHDGSGFLWGIYEWKADGSAGDVRYPVGKFLYCGMANEGDFRARVERLAALPGQLRQVLEGCEVDGALRPGAWTVRQVVHHLADGNAVMAERVRLILTEQRPLVKTFDEDRWAQLEDARTAPVEESLRILEGVHGRLARLLQSIALDDLEREMEHPEQGFVKLDRLLSYLDWHGRHHLAQIGSRTL